MLDQPGCVGSMRAADWPLPKRRSEVPGAPLARRLIAQKVRQHWRKADGETMIALGIMLVLAFLRMPIAIAMGLIGFLGLPEKP